MVHFLIRHSTDKRTKVRQLITVGTSDTKKARQMLQESYGERVAPIVRDVGGNDC